MTKKMQDEETTILWRFNRIPSKAKQSHLISNHLQLMMENSQAVQTM